MAPLDPAAAGWSDHDVATEAQVPARQSGMRAASVLRAVTARGGSMDTMHPLPHERWRPAPWKNPSAGTYVVIGLAAVTVVGGGAWWIHRRQIARAHGDPKAWVLDTEYKGWKVTVRETTWSGARSVPLWTATATKNLFFPQTLYAEDEPSVEAAFTAIRAKIDAGYVTMGSSNAA